MKKYSDNFISRDVCEVCLGDKDLNTIISIPYSNEDISDFLIDRYAGNIKRSDISDAYFEIINCRKCNFTFQKYAPTDLLAEKIYTYPESRILESIKKHTNADIKYYRKNSLLVEKMSAVCRVKEPYKFKVLDVGMGWGGFLIMANAYGFPVIGVEISKERQEYVSKKSIPFVSSMNDIKEEFDYVHLDQTLEHITDPRKMLEDVSKLVKKGGYVYIHVPNGTFALKDIGKDTSNFKRKLIHPLEHVNCFSHDALVNISSSYGLKLISKYDVAKRLFSEASLLKNGQLIQEALRTLYQYNRDTQLYFIKENSLEVGDGF